MKKSQALKGSPELFVPFALIPAIETPTFGSQRIFVGATVSKVKYTILCFSEPLLSSPSIRLELIMLIVFPSAVAVSTQEKNPGALSEETATCPYLLA